MNRRHLLFLSCFFTASFLRGLQCGAQVQNADSIVSRGYPPGELQLTLSSDKKVYSARDPIRLSLTLENISQRELGIQQYGAPLCSYWPTLTNKQGEEIGVHRYISDTGSINLPINWRKKLRPAGKLTEQILLGSMIDVPGPGFYRLQILRFPQIGDRLTLEMLMRENKPLHLDRLLGLESNEIEFEVQ